jgi:hypothetical protein
VTIEITPEMIEAGIASVPGCSAAIVTAIYEAMHHAKPKVDVVGKAATQVAAAISREHGEVWPFEVWEAWQSLSLAIAAMEAGEGQ